MSVAARIAGPDLHETSVAPRSRSRMLALVIALAFAAVGGQLVRLAWQNEDASTIRVSMMSSPANTWRGRISWIATVACWRPTCKCPRSTPIRC